MRLPRTTVAALAAALLVAGCGGGGSGGDPEGGDGAGGQQASPTTVEDDTATDEGEEAAAEDVVITISDFTFEVPEAVEPGAEVTVRNEDSVGHTVTADDGEAFDVPVGPGEEVTFTVPEAKGQYPFHCTPHPDMTETLVVG